MLNNKIAVITGCNKGIGLETLKLFSNNKVKKIYACVRKLDDNLNQVLNNISKNSLVEIDIIECDFSNESSVKNAGELIISRSNKIDILVNNVGSINSSLFQMTTLESIKNIFDINFFHQYKFTQLISKSILRNSKGSIIFISSSSAIDGNPGRSSYSSSKNSIIALSKTLSREFGKKNIRVNSISPGPIDTEMLHKNTPKDLIEKMVNNISLGRIGTPIEVANLILFLSSDLSSLITGQNIRIDGGMNP